MNKQTPIAYSLEEGGELKLKIVNLDSISIAQQCLDSHDQLNWVDDSKQQRGSGVSILKWYNLSVLTSTDLSKQCSLELKLSVVYFPHPTTPDTVIWDSILGIFIIGSSPIKQDSIPRNLHDFLDLIHRHKIGWEKIGNFQRNFLSDPKRN